MNIAIYLHLLINNHPIGRVADDSVEAGGVAAENIGEGDTPVEGVYPLRLVGVVGAAIEIVGGNEGVAALDVAGQVGQGALVDQAKLRGDGVGVLAFQDFEQQGELGDFDGLGVEID